MGAWRIPPGFTVWGTELGEKKALVYPGEGEWRSKRDTGQFFPAITYPTHGKKLAQRGDCRILRRCSVSPSPQLCRCPPKRCRAPTHGRRQYSWWSEPSPPGGTSRLATGMPRRRPPLSSGPTSRTCSSSSLRLHSVCASRLTGGNAYLRKAQVQLCASASLPRGPSVREKYSWQWEDSGEANRST